MFEWLVRILVKCWDEATRRSLSKMSGRDLTQAEADELIVGTAANALSANTTPALPAKEDEPEPAKGRKAK